MHQHHQQQQQLVGENLRNHCCIVQGSKARITRLRNIVCFRSRLSSSTKDVTTSDRIFRLTRGDFLKIAVRSSAYSLVERENPLSAATGNRRIIVFVFVASSFSIDQTIRRSGLCSETYGVESSSLLLLFLCDLAALPAVQDLLPLLLLLLQSARLSHQPSSIFMMSNNYEYCCHNTVSNPLSKTDWAGRQLPHTRKNES